MKAPIIVAHRGLHHEHPENSRSAFRAAWDAGWEWCECDVRGTSCHTPVVIHDEILQRTTTMSGRVDALPWSLLRDAKLRRGDGSPTDDPLPRLEDILPPADSSSRLLVEIKPGLSDRVIQQVMSLARSNIEVQSFDLRIVHTMQELRPDIRAHWLIEDARLVAQSTEGLWHGVNLAHQLIDSVLVKRLHEAGKTVGAWTANDLPDIQRMLELGIDMIITDEPERIRDATDRLKSST